MAKAEWGVKRICPSCAARFYDLLRDPIVCPACGVTVDLAALMKPKRGRAAAPVAKPVPKKPVVEVDLEEDLDTTDDDDDDDDVLDLDDDDDVADTPIPVKKVGKSDKAVDETAAAFVPDDDLLLEDDEEDDDDDDDDEISLEDIVEDDDDADEEEET